MNVLKGEPKAARIFLNILAKTPFHRAWAEERKRELEADSRLAQDPELQQVRSLLLTEDHPFGVTTEPILLQCLHQNRTNRMAFEYLMAHYLLTRQLDNFLHYLPAAKAFNYPEIPAHYEEALLVARTLKGAPLAIPNINGKTPRAETIQRFERFNGQLRARNKGSGAGQSRDAERVWQHLLVLLRLWTQRCRLDSNRPVYAEAMNPRPCLSRALLPLLLLIAGSFGHLALPAVGSSSGGEGNRLPKIDPDYCGVVIPPNIAPLNFRIEKPGISFAVELQGQAGKPIQVTSRKPEIAVPIRPWRALLEANRGKEFSIRVTVKNTNGAVARFAAITNFVTREEIDGYLVYRRLNWQFSKYGNGNIGIYQRNLSDFEESEIVRVKERGERPGTCVNCHTFLQHRPEIMALHARVNVTGEKPMVIANEGKVTTVGKPFGLLAWHPSGRLLAFSQNRFSTVLHTIGPKTGTCTMAQATWGFIWSKPGPW